MPLDNLPLDAEPLDGGGEGNPLPIDLMAAIQAAATADGYLAGVGPIFRGNLPPTVSGQAQPASYLVFSQASSTLLFKSSSSQVHDVRVRLRLYHQDPDQAQALGRLVEARAPAWGALPYQNGQSIPLVRVGGSNDPTKNRRSGDKAAWYSEAVYSARTIEPLP